MAIKLKIKQTLNQSLELKQSLKLNQAIEISNLIAIPDEVLNIVVRAISHNPDSVELSLQEAKSESEKNYLSSSQKVKKIYSSLIPSKGDSRGRKRLIVSPDLRTLEGCLGDYQTVVTPDVTFIGRRDEKPELDFSDHLKGSMNLIMNIVDASKYPKTAKLMSQLRSFDTWKREELRKSYVLIGGVQREYFEDFDKQRFNVFSQDRLSNKLGLHVSIVSRILANRWVKSRNIRGDQKYTSAKYLLKTKDDIGRYRATPLMNNVFKKEFEQEEAYPDRIIRERINNIIAKRTVAKYRTWSGVPGIYKRNKMYQNKELKEPYEISFD